MDMDGLMMKIDTVARTIDMQMHLKGITSGLNLFNVLLSVKYVLQCRLLIRFASEHD